MRPSHQFRRVAAAWLLVDTKKKGNGDRQRRKGSKEAEDEALLYNKQHGLKKQYMLCPMADCIRRVATKPRE